MYLRIVVVLLLAVVGVLPVGCASTAGSVAQAEPEAHAQALAGADSAQTETANFEPVWWATD